MLASENPKRWLPLSVRSPDESLGSDVGPCDRVGPSSTSSSPSPEAPTGGFRRSAPCNPRFWSVLFGRRDVFCGRGSEVGESGTRMGQNLKTITTSGKDTPQQKITKTRIHWPPFPDLSRFDGLRLPEFDPVAVVPESEAPPRAACRPSEGPATCRALLGQETVTGTVCGEVRCQETDVLWCRNV